MEIEKPLGKSNYDSTSDSDDDKISKVPVNFDIIIERRGMYTHDPQSRLPESQSPTAPRFQKKFFLPQLADKITEATEDEVQLAHSRESRLILTSKRNDRPP